MRDHDAVDIFGDDESPSLKNRPGNAVESSYISVGLVALAWRRSRSISDTMLVTT